MWEKLTVKLRNRSKYWWLVVAIILVFILGGLAWSWNGDEVELIKADTGTVSQTVSVSGKTLSASAVDLAFEKSGQIVQVGAEAGQEVRAGQLLIALESGELAANLAAEEAHLAELRRGTRPEELAITEAEVDEAMQNAWVVSDDAVYNTADTFFGTRKGDWRKNLILFIPDHPNLVDDLLVERAKIEELLTDWRHSINGEMPISDSTVANYLNQINEFLTLLAKGINDLETGNDNDFTESEIEGYKTTLAASRQEVVNALATLNSASKQLNLDLQGTSPEAIASQLARVDQYKAALAKNYLYAPISGTVTKQEGKVGEIAPAGETIVSIITLADLEVESLVPEVHIGRLSIGNTAEITLDALSGVTFTGRITYIDPAETLVSGVPNYKIKVVFDNKDERLRSGLTANLKIETARKDEVVRLPRFALTERDGNFYVTKARDGGNSLSLVEVGLQGTDGLVEIISGVASGEEVIIPNNTENQVES